MSWRLPTLALNPEPYKLYKIIPYPKSSAQADQKLLQDAEDIVDSNRRRTLASLICLIPR